MEGLPGNLFETIGIEKIARSMKQGVDSRPSCLDSVLQCWFEISGAVETVEQRVPDTGVPSDFGDELHNIRVRYPHP